MKSNFKLEIDIPALYKRVIHEVNAFDKQEKVLDKAITLIKESLQAEEKTHKLIATKKEKEETDDITMLLEKRLAEYPETIPLLVITMCSGNAIAHQLQFYVKRGQLPEFTKYDKDNSDMDTHYLHKCKCKRSIIYSHLFSKAGWDIAETTNRSSRRFEFDNEYDHTHYLYLAKDGIILKAKVDVSVFDSD